MGITCVPVTHWHSGRRRVVVVPLAVVVPVVVVPVHVVVAGVSLAVVAVPA